jgi:hypothetical protein
MNDSADWRFTSIDPGGGSAEGNRWRMVNANYDLMTKLIADIQRRLTALEAEVAKLSPPESVGDDDTTAN